MDGDQGGGGKFVDKGGDRGSRVICGDNDGGGDAVGKSSGDDGTG